MLKYLVHLRSKLINKAMASEIFKSQRPVNDSSTQGSYIKKNESSYYYTIIKA